MKKRNLTQSRHAQNGVYAIEFAFVFLILFALLYAVFCYGLLLTMRMSLQNAAEDGARAGLRYQSNLDNRKTEASAVAMQRSNWLPPALKANRAVAATICVAEGDDCPPASPACGPTWSSRCQMVVTVSVSGIDTLFPALPSFAMPSQIAGKASMLLDGRPL